MLRGQALAQHLATKNALLNYLDHLDHDLSVVFLTMLNSGFHPPFPRSPMVRIYDSHS